MAHNEMTESLKRPVFQIKNPNPKSNVCKVELNLPWDMVMGFVDLVTQLSELGTERQRWEAERAYAVRGLEAKRRKEAIFLAGLEIAHQARKQDKPIEAIAIHTAAKHHLLDSVAVHSAQSIRYKLKKRYHRMRNKIILRMIREGSSYEKIAERFRISKGRVAQIAKENA